MTDAKTPLSEDQKIRRRMARAIGRTIWRAEFKATYPQASKEDLNRAWGEARSMATKAGMRAVKALEKEGYSFTAPEGVADDQE